MKKNHRKKLKESKKIAGPSAFLEHFEGENSVLDKSNSLTVNEMGIFGKLFMPVDFTKTICQMAT